MINPVNSTTVNTASTVTGPAAATTPPEENQALATPLAEWPPLAPEPLTSSLARPDILRDDHPGSSVVQEDGKTLPPSGTYDYPAGTVVFADSSYRLPDGVLHRSDGFTEFPDGSVQDPDGFVYTTDGKMDHVDNTDGTKSYSKDRSGMIHIFDSDPPIIGTDEHTGFPITADPRSTQVPFGATEMDDGRLQYPGGVIRDAGGGVQRGNILTHADGREENLTDGTIKNLDGEIVPRPRFVVTALGGGRFSIGGKEVNIENLFLHISNELSTGVQADMKKKTEDLQIKNAAVAKLNEYIGKLSEMRGHMDDVDGVWLSRARNTSGKDLGIREGDDARNQAIENAKLFEELGNFSLGGTMGEDGKTIEWGDPKEDFGIPAFQDRADLYTDSFYVGYADNPADGEWKNVTDPGDYDADAVEAAAALGITIPTGRSDEIGDLTNHDGDDSTPDEAIDVLSATGVGQVTDYKISGAQLDAYIQKLKGKVEELNSNTQLEMIDLQELVSQNNRHYDMASNIISKAGSNRQTIAGNIRA